MAVELVFVLVCGVTVVVLVVVVNGGCELAAVDDLAVVVVGDVVELAVVTAGELVVDDVEVLVDGHPVKDNIRATITTIIAG